MSDFIKEIIIRMTPDKPKSQSDLEVIKQLLSDKFIVFHMALLKQGASIMASVAQLEAAVANLQATVVNEAEEVSTEVANLKALIEAGASDNGIPPEALDGILASINSVSESVSKIIVAATPVEPLAAE